jgi:hypothetical protein
MMGQPTAWYIMASYGPERANSPHISTICLCSASTCGQGLRNEGVPYGFTTAGQSAKRKNGCGACQIGLTYLVQLPGTTL